MDIVVTCPKHVWEGWIAEGDLPGTVWDGEVEYHWFGRGPRPRIQPGERVYVVAHGKLRGYAPLVATDCLVTGRRKAEYSLVRLGPSHFHEGHPIGQTITHWYPNPLPDWWWPGADWGLVRQGNAVACTIPDPIRGFQGFRYRWWEREAEVPFPDFQTP